MSPLIAILLIALSGAAAAFIFNRHLASLSCPQLARLMFPHMLRNVEGVLDDPYLTGTLVGASGGMKGLARLWWNRAIQVRLCQARFVLDGNEDEYLRETTRLASRLAFRLVIAGIILPFRRIIPSRADSAYRTVLLLYREVAYRVHSVWSDDDCTECAAQLAAML